MPRGMGGVFQRGDVWWIRYYYRGKQKRESSLSVSRAEAVKLLKKRQGEIGLGRFVGLDAERVTFEDLRGILVADYKANDRKSADRAGAALDHLAEAFGTDRALDITKDRLAAYVAARRDEAMAATIRYELATLKRAFNLAIDAGRLDIKPVFPKIVVKNTRKGFFEEADFLAVSQRLDEYVRPLAQFLYRVGWRSGEGRQLEWRQVDLKAGVIRIEENKGDDPRTLPYHALPELVQLINEQRDRADAIQREKGVIVTHVFFWSDGTRIRSFRNAWDRACKAAGVTRLPHDLRRTAARDLSRRGVPEKVIMAICGWKTRSVFDRYRIVNEADIADGLARMAAPAAAVQGRRGHVLQMGTSTERAQSAKSGNDQEDRGGRK